MCGFLRLRRKYWRLKPGNKLYWVFVYEKIYIFILRFEEESGIEDCIGIIDGTHVALTGLKKDIEHGYINRKSFHSLNVQIVSLLFSTSYFRVHPVMPLLLKNKCYGLNLCLHCMYLFLIGAIFKNIFIIRYVTMIYVF